MTAQNNLNSSLISLLSHYTTNPPFATSSTLCRKRKLSPKEFFFLPLLRKFLLLHLCRQRQCWREKRREGDANANANTIKFNIFFLVGCFTAFVLSLLFPLHHHHSLCHVLFVIRTKNYAFLPLSDPRVYLSHTHFHTFFRLWITFSQLAQFKRKKTEKFMIIYGKEI